MDKEWMNEPRPGLAYVRGVDAFLDFAFKKVGFRTGEIPCPCLDCANRLYKNRSVARLHLLENGFMIGYTRWVFHGESSASTSIQGDHEIGLQEDDHEEFDQMSEMVNDILRGQGDEFFEKSDEYLNDANQPLYPGCKDETALSFIVWLYNLKCTGKWPDWSFDRLISKLKTILPEGVNIPDDFYSTKKMVGDLGFCYEKIDACKNDCMLFWEENSSLNSCKTCHESRWKTVSVVSKSSDEVTTTKESKVAVKQLRYFPLTPRLKRLFYSSKTVEDMKWHHLKRRKDGVYHHPADSKAWKHFDGLYPDFAAECRNVRLGLSTDGMNPFTHGASHSIWPVTLVVYNLPPWRCMKHSHFIMPLLIPGPTTPGNNIDVYLKPLILELQSLWENGVETYDASIGSTFIMRAAFLWTISDFPALADLMGWATKGYKACPVCLTETRSYRIRGKQCYMGHRCFLEAGHKYRYDKRRFDGKEDHREAPKVLSGFEIYEQIKDIKVIFGKTTTDTIPHESTHNWRKMSIFYQLPYWRSLLIRHNLDIMHIEKNVCDNLIGTLLGMPGKSKDTLKARLDLQDWGIRKELHPQPVGTTGKEFKLPAASFTLSKKEKQEFLQVLKNVKVPDGYSSNISRCINVKDCKISGLKSHDCHILLQQLLPIAIRSTPLPEHVKTALIDFCHYFRELCSTNYREDDFARLSKKIPVIVSNLEMIFPPAFFSVMVHLPVHLADQARIAGNCKFLSMWPFERYMYKTKGFIRNRSKPEGSIAEGLVAEECLTFCSRYLADNQATWNRAGRNEDGYEQGERGLSIFQKKGRMLGIPSPLFLRQEEREIGHAYILFNCEEIQKYLRIWESSYRMRSRQRLSAREVDNAQKKNFPGWFRGYVRDLIEDIPIHVKALANGPYNVARRAGGYLVNGFRFHTEKIERKRKTQNSGVYVVAMTRGYSSARDSNPREEEMEYFGILEDVIEFDYGGELKVVLFKCKWYDSIARGRGVKTDQYGYTLLNANRFAAQNDPFILPSQVLQIFYLDDHRDKDWRVVVRTKPRDLCENVEVESDDDEQIEQNEHPVSLGVDNDMEGMTWDRGDIDGEFISLDLQRPRKRKRSESSRLEGEPRGSRLNNHRVEEHIEEDQEDDVEEEEEEEDMDLDCLSDFDSDDNNED